MNMAQFSQKIICSWVISGDTEKQGYTIQKTFDDGTDVILKILRSDTMYLVMSSAESRTSGPNESLIGTYATLEDAIQVVEGECEDWELHMNTDLKQNLNDLRLL